MHLSLQHILTIIVVILVGILYIFFPGTLKSVSNFLFIPSYEYVAYETRDVVATPLEGKDTYFIIAQPPYTTFKTLIGKKQEKVTTDSSGLFAVDKNDIPIGPVSSIEEGLAVVIPFSSPDHKEIYAVNNIIFEGVGRGIDVSGTVPLTTIVDEGDIIIHQATGKHIGKIIDLQEEETNYSFIIGLYVNLFEVSTFYIESI